jgi:hypothetical protein
VTNQDEPAGFRGKTHIAAILDRSGSMEPMVNEVITGYNDWLTKIQEHDGDVLLTTTLFDTEYTVLCTDLPVKHATVLTKDLYWARGFTALNDAIMSGLNQLEPKVGDDDRALVLVITDGQENSSKEYGGSAGTKQVRDRLANLEARGNWTFTYMSASPSAFADAEAYGTQAASSASFAATPGGTREAFTNVVTSTQSYLDSRQKQSRAFYQKKDDTDAEK